MLFKDLLEQLALGELDQHTISGDGVITEEHYDKIIVALNQGLTTLHTKFPLKTEELLLQQFDEITEYKLVAKHALTDTTDPSALKWIIDSPEDPFLDDVLRIDAVFNEVGYPIPLNDNTTVFSWFTPKPDTLQIPYPNLENTNAIIYRANHVKIPLGTTDLNTQIDIPQYLEEALTSYIASKVYVSMGNASSGNLSAYYRARFNELLIDIERYNLSHSSDGDANLGILRGGWV